MEATIVLKFKPLFYYEIAVQSKLTLESSTLIFCVHSDFAPQFFKPRRPWYLLYVDGLASCCNNFLTRRRVCSRAILTLTPFTSPKNFLCSRDKGACMGCKTSL